MGFYKKLFIRISQLPAFNIGLLMCLAFFAFIKSVMLVFADIGSVQLYLTKTGHLSLGVDFILVAVLFSYVGQKTRGLFKYQGYGGFRLMTLLILVLTALIVATAYHIPGVYDGLFIVKYAYFYLINAVFWSLTTRFVPFDRRSLKNVFLMAAEAGGYFCGGLVVYVAPVGAYSLLYYAMALLMILYTGIYLLMQMMPVLPERFSRSSGEAQDFTARRLTRSVLVFSFFTLTAFCLQNAVFYVQLVQTHNGFGILKQTALWWSCFGLAEIFLVLLLARARSFYMLAGALFLMILSVAGMSIALSSAGYVLSFFSFLIFMLVYYLCYSEYMIVLLKTLVLRQDNPSIHQKRVTLIEPVGLMLGGILTAHMLIPAYLACLLAGLSIFLTILLVLITFFYGDVVLKLLKLREWPGSRLMLISHRITDYIRQEMQQASTDEIIYFLRILENAPTKEYYKFILKSLKNPSEAVRLFALKRIFQSQNFLRYHSSVQFVFQTDKSASVQAQALAILIQIAAATDNTALLNKYALYLDDRRLKTGAMIGFLNIGSHEALLAMDGLQKLANSRMASDKLAALQVMAQAPSVGLIRLLMPLLKSVNPAIANEALTVAGLIKHPESLPIILHSLDEVDFQENALTALDRFGIRAYPAIEKSIFDEVTSLVRKRLLILFLARRNDNESHQILLRVLKSGNRKLRNSVIHGMIDSGIFWHDKDKYAFLKTCIMQDAARIRFLNNFIEKYKQAPVSSAQDAFLFLTRAMSEEASAARALIFYELLLLKKSPLFQKAVHVLLSDEYESYPPALGVIQDILPRDLYQTVAEAAKFPFVHKKEIALPAVAKKEAVKDVSDLILNPAFAFPSWITASAVYCLQKMNDKEALPAVKAALNSTDLLVVETAVQALDRLNDDSAETRRLILSLPSATIVKLPLEKLLKI